MSKHSISNKDLTIFLVVTFGLTTIMGIVMAFTYTKYSMNSFAVVQMYYPAIGVMIALLLNSERREELPIKFYGVYLFFTITSVLFLLAEVFVFHKEPGTYMEYFMFPLAIMLPLIYFTDDKEKIDRFGLRVEKKLKASIHYIVLFVILKLCVTFLRALISGGFKEVITTFQNAEIFGSSFLFLFLFPFQFTAFLGEEYGWRYFLQTALQERLGKRRGIILLGFIWGIWHLPLDLFFYNPTAPFYCVLNHQITCITFAVFLGFVYMKTENVWTISIIHYINNGISFGVGIVPSWKSILVNLICMSVVYLPFLFTKEYGKTEVKVSNHTC